MRLFPVTRRRKEVEAEFAAAYTEVRRWRPKKIFRHRDWLRDLDALDAILRWLMRATAVEEINKQAASIQQIVVRCKDRVENETRIAATIDAAAKRADALRQRAASLRGSAFQQAERRHHALKDECNHALRAKDARSEEAALAVIERKLAAFEVTLARAEQVTEAMPAMEARIGAIKPEEVWLDTGAKETYDDILATFAEAQKDLKRGDYDKAEQRLREIDTLQGHLRDRSSRRTQWALDEVAMWSSCESVVDAFPELTQFPNSTMSSSDIESLYALRPEIERFVAARAAHQREQNVPTRDLGNGRKLASSHPLRMPLKDCTDPSELEEFLRCVTAFGH